MRVLREKKGKRASQTSGASTMPSKAEARVELCLLIGPRQIGLGLGKPVRLGPVSIDEIEVDLPGLGFPLDVSGGVSRFRHRRGELRRLRLSASWDDVCTYATVRLRDTIVRGAPRVRVERVAAADGERSTTLAIEIAEAGPARRSPTVPNDATWISPPSVLAFEVTVGLTDDDLVLVVGEARGFGLRAPATRLAIEAVARVLGAPFRAEGASFSFVGLGTTIAAAVFPEAGARAPRAGTIGPQGLVFDAHGLELTLREGRGFVGDERAVRALEAARLTLETDRHLVAGDLDGARAAAVEALEKAPRHPEIARRLVELDVLVEGRSEATSSFLRDAERSLSLRLGDLPTTLLERTGDRKGAFARAVRDAEREPSPILRATLHGRAASLSTEPLAALRQLDEAATDAPAYPFVHWAALVRCLEAARFDDAASHAGFLEALVPLHAEKCAVLVAVGNAYVLHGHRVRAREPFEHALRYAPDDPDALTGLGEALVSGGLAVRGAAILARAATLARTSDTRATATLALARALEDPVGDLPAAAARAREIPSGHATSPHARLLEGRVRAKSGDHEGALLSFARLREEPLTETHVALLLEAAQLERERLADPAAAWRSIRRALALAPLDPALLAFERDLHGSPVATRPAPASKPLFASDLQPISAPLPSPDPAPTSLGFETHADADPDEDVLAARVEVLTDKLRADPERDEVVDELVFLLTRLGRGLELLALLSARLEDAPPDRRDALVVHQRAVLKRLEADAREAGRNEEASLFAMSCEMLGPA